DSESTLKAHVHCVIVGFSNQNHCHPGAEQNHCHPGAEGDRVQNTAVDSIGSTSLQNDPQAESSKNMLACFYYRGPESSAKRNDTSSVTLEPNKPLSPWNGAQRSDRVQNDTPKYIYDESGNKKEARNINAYLLDGENIFVESRSNPICDVPLMNFGNMPRDGGNLIIEASDYDDFIKQEPSALKYIHPLLGAEEYLNNKKRYCLWLDGASPAEIRKMPKVYERVCKCRDMRLASKAASTQKMAEIPHLFAQRTQPMGVPYIIVPQVTSERRRYIPIGFMSPDVIVTNLVQIIPNATLYHFGILTSNVHNAWMRAVCGRLKSDYRYSKDIVYNNFPWPSLDERRKTKDERSGVKDERGQIKSPAKGVSPEQIRVINQEKIMSTAQAILDARAKYPDCSLADLYD
ncbi:MAG: hypothetical protein HUK20_06515, partial [Fibrobacter sp.]|nr:hypothetical protein [Fibrobacter sp.]